MNELWYDFMVETSLPNKYVSTILSSLNTLLPGALILKTKNIFCKISNTYFPYIILTVENRPEHHHSKKTASL